MPDSFHDIAKDYDSSFTFSEIGKKQRSLVYYHISNSIGLATPKSTLNVLEINGGTGEDALWWATKGHQVLFTDASESMTQIAQAKSQLNNPQYHTLDIKNIVHIQDKGPFDVVFSNFGGLNCLNETELKIFFQDCLKLTSNKAVLSLVIMPKNCLWEKIFFSFKREWHKVNRREKRVNMVKLGDQEVATYFYNPKDIKRLSKPLFEITNIKPIGLFVPPSYLEPLFKKRKKLLSILYYLDLKLSRFSFFARFSDHYLIELKRK